MTGQSEDNTDEHVTAPSISPARAGGAALLLVCIMALFAVSVWMRSPWLGMVPEPPANISINPEINSGLSMRAVNEWLSSEPVPAYRRVFLVFGAALETNSTVLRMREIAYMPLSWLPLYWYGRAKVAPLSMTDIHVMSLLCQAVVVFASGLLVYLVQFSRYGIRPAFLGGLAAAAFQTFLPGPLYLNLYCFFPDIAVLPVLAVLLLAEHFRDEALRADRRRAGRMFGALVAVLLFIGGMVEWLMYPVAVALALKRALSGEFGHTLRGVVAGLAKSMIPTACAACMFFFYVTVNTGWVEVLIKFLIHASVVEASVAESDLIPVYVMQYLPRALGSWALLPLAVVLLVGIVGYPSAALAARKHGVASFPAPALAVLFVLAVGCVGDVLLLRDHHIENPHTALKFCLPYGVGLGLLVGAARRAQLQSYSLLRSARKRVVAIAVLVFASIAWLRMTTPDFHALMSPGTNRYQENASRFTPELMEPDMLFASFALGHADHFVGPAFYHRQVYPMAAMADWLPMLAGKASNPLMPEMFVPYFQKGQALGLAPDWEAPLPEDFTVGFVHWRDEPAPPEFETIARYAKRVVDTAHAKLYVLDAAAIRAYFEDHPISAES